MRRDPLVDPQHGDVVKKGSRRRRVVERQGNDIWYATGDLKSPRLCWITTWVAWCQKAEVIHVAEFDQSNGDGDIRVEVVTKEDKRGKTR